MGTALDRLKVIQERIGKAADRAHRKSEEITLVAVTKNVPFDNVIPFINAGIHHFGENRVQEALSKYQNPDGSKPAETTLHLIGPLQSNKAKKAVAFFDLIQSLDRWDLAEDVNRHAAALGKVQDCLIEVKVSEESTKSGLAPEAFPELLERLASLSNLRVRGVMGIPPASATGATARPYFLRLRRLFEASKLEILSMGMSSDFETAIEEGSTMVRIGTALFGPREG